MPALLPRPATVRLRFGLFEVDPTAEELHKAGIRVRIQSQPFRILLHLAQHAGEIVSREDLHRTFWKSDTTVDLDRSLAAAIHKIRECLGDSVTNPRFIETVSRSGYRFIAPTAEIPPEADLRSTEPANLAAGSSPMAALPDEFGVALAALEIGAQRSWISASRPAISWAVTGLALAVLLLYMIASRPTSSGSPAIRLVTHNASASRPDFMSQGFPGAITDNSRIYFSRRENGNPQLAVVMLNGGETTTILLPEELGSPVADDVSPDGLRLLLRNRLSTLAEQALWVASPAGQTARQVPGVLAHDSAWMPDGDTILYANGDSLYTVRDNGSGNQPLITLPGRPYRMRFSPDGKLLRLTLRNDRTLDTTLWELRSDGSRAHQILPGWHGGESVCCGTFLASGDLFVFQSGNDDSGSLWAMPVHAGWFGGQREPFRVAEGPLNYVAPVATRSGRGVVFTGFDPSSRLLTCRDADHRLLPAPDFLNDAVRLEFSRDHRWVAWVRRDDRSLWRSRADGSDRVRVIGAPYQIFSLSWSPDANRLALMARRPSSPWHIFLTDVNSGHIEDLLPDDSHNESDPQWSSDGKEVIFGRLPPRAAEPNLLRAIFRVNLRTRSVAKLQGSDGLFSPRVSSDGRILIALTADQSTLRQMDLNSGTWTTAATGHFDSPVFLSSGHSLVFRDFSEPGIQFLRLDLATHKTAPFAEGIEAEPGLPNPSFAGLLIGDEPAVSVMRDSADIYELNLPE